MSDEIAIAFVSTSRPWGGRWHRHLRDHGPVTVVDVIAEPQTAYDHAWRLLVVDATSVMVDPGFVQVVHERGRGLLAVWDPTEPATKERAINAGADDLIECDAAATELVAKIAALAPHFPAQAPRTERARRRPLLAPAARRTGQLIVVGGPPGAEPEHVALALGRAFGARGEATLVIDVNDVCPSLAQMVDCPPTPNLASAIAAMRASADMDEHLQAVDRYWLLAGLADPGQWGEFSTAAVRSLVLAYAARFPRTVAAVGPLAENLARTGDRFATTRALIAEADAVVSVGVANPVGMTRLTSWVADVRSLTLAPLYLAASDAPRDRFRKAEVLERLGAMGSPAQVVLLPNDDARIGRAQWNGRPVRRGPLVRSVSDLADIVGPRSRRKR